ncbi:hypothetical protein AFLA_012610 [Aspergillus flavus NRRL3357]|nr:hypothetical protein AFLA_012610 [Aspergillus flavus NRRL3357]
MIQDFQAQRQSHCSSILRPNERVGRSRRLGLNDVRAKDVLPCQEGLPMHLDTYPSSWVASSLFISFPTLPDSASGRCTKFPAPLALQVWK